MISDLSDRDSIRSISPIIIHNDYHLRQYLLSCCTRKTTQQLPSTNEEAKIDVQKPGFFKRIQSFKGLKI